MDLHRKLTWSQARATAIEQYLADHSTAKLQLGAGEHALPGWFNTDLRPSPQIYHLDSTTRFPFPDATFDYLFSEHHIEHIGWEQAQFMLGECYRVLKPGGRIRIATPDLQALAGLLADQLNNTQQRYVEFMSESFLRPGTPAGVAGVVNNAFVSWGHQFLYDGRTLSSNLVTAGFVEPSSHAPGESADEQLRAIEGHGDFIGDEQMNRFETMVVEARRPT